MWKKYALSCLFSLASCLVYANTTPAINTNQLSYGLWHMQFGKADSQLPPSVHVNSQGFDNGKLQAEQAHCQQQNSQLHIQTPVFSGQALHQALSRRMLSLNTQMVDILKYQSKDQNGQEHTAQIGQIRALLHHIDARKSYTGIYIQYCSGYNESFIPLNNNKALYFFSNHQTERYGLFGKK